MAINAILGDGRPHLAGHFTYFLVPMTVTGSTSLRKYFCFAIFILVNVVTVYAADLPDSVTLA